MCLAVAGVALLLKVLDIGDKIDNSNTVNEVNNIVNNTNTAVNNTVSNEIENEVVENTVETPTVSKKAYPGGFAGAGMHEVQLYSNGEVYVIVFDGTGTESQNIASKTLVAKNASDIQENEQGGVDVLGENAILQTQDYAWIKISK